MALAPITSVDWPLRLIPRRSPPILVSFTVAAGAMVTAVAVRGVFLGWDQATGFSVTYLPAFILATLYGGARWGWAALVAALALGFSGQSSLLQGVSAEALAGMFGVSGVVTILAASALRETVLRLDEARRREEEVRVALDSSEARLRLAQDAGDVGLWDWNVETGEGHWSPTLYRNLGLDPSVPANVRRLIEAAHPDDRELVRQANITAVKRGVYQPIEYRVVWPDGTVRWLLSRGEILRDRNTGVVTRALGVTIDVTERHVAFQRLLESEARFRSMADSAPVLMWVSKTDGKREFVNQAYVDFLGVSYDEAVNFDWRLRLFDEDLPRILAEQVAGESSRRMFTLEARYRRADGEWRWVRSVSQPRYGPTGEFIGFIGVGYDVTDAKRAETDLMQINQLLAERVDAALAERDQAEAAFRHAQKLEAVGRLTGGVAHDFNNLLTVIIGALDLLQRRPGDVARQAKMVDAALGAARRGERLTQQLLAFSRRQALQPQATRVDKVLSDSEPLLRRAVGEAVSLTISPGAGEALAMIDPSQLEAALMNLVVNARDAVLAGGIIRVETQVCELLDGQVAETPAGSYVRLDVHDTGVGMDADVMAQVFEPFFTTKDVGKGTGLGLSQVYGFARQSGGGVAIESAPGKGATVRLYLPRELAAVEIPEAPAAPEVRGPALSVVLAEDDPAVGEMVQALLEGLGHRVQRVADADSALALFTRGVRADLLLSDIVMPGERNGLDLAAEVSRLRPDLPILLSSGYMGDALPAPGEVPWPLLRKPYSSQDLADAIAGVMQRAPASA